MSINESNNSLDIEIDGGLNLVILSNVQMQELIFLQVGA